MKLNIRSLRSLVRKTLAEDSRRNKKLIGSKNTSRREKKLVENALRLLESAQAANLDDFSQEELAEANEQLKTFDVTAGLAKVVEWLNIHLTESSNPAKENEPAKVARAMHAILANGQLDGDNDQKFNLSKKMPIATGKLAPTQGEIDLFKSIGHPLCNPKSFIDCFSGDPHGRGKTIVTAGESLVLDGHHRWSTVACIAGPEQTIDCVNFGIDSFGADAEAVLSAAQVAIVGSADYDTLKKGSKMVPFATTSEVTSGGQVINTNILGNPSLIKDTIKKLIETGNADLTPFDSYAGSYANSVMLSDAYMHYALYDTVMSPDMASNPSQMSSDDTSALVPGGADPQNSSITESAERPNPDAFDMESKAGKKAFKEAQDEWLSQYEDSGTVDPADGFSQKFCSHFGINPKPTSEAPQGWYSYSKQEKEVVIDAVLDKLVENWSGVKGASSAAGKPDRNVMPQFDGGKSHKDQIDDKAVFSGMVAGDANYKPAFVDPKRLAAGKEFGGDVVNESIDLQRWNKLAGLLKD